LKWVEDYLFDPLQHFGEKEASVNLQTCWAALKREKIIDTWTTVFCNGKKFFSDEENQNFICPEDEIIFDAASEEDLDEHEPIQPLKEKKYSVKASTRKKNKG
jgi:hypothetical protein